MERYEFGGLIQGFKKNTKQVRKESCTLCPVLPLAHPSSRGRHEIQFTSPIDSSDLRIPPMAITLLAMSRSAPTGQHSIHAFSQGAVFELNRILFFTI
jgi:hypothetical protein